MFTQAVGTSVILTALALGAARGALTERLPAEERRKKALLAALETLSGMTRVASLDRQCLKKELGARVAGIKEQLAGALRGDGTPHARQALRKVLAGPLEVTPVGDEGKRGFRFSGQGTFARLLTGERLPPMVVPPG